MIATTSDKWKEMERDRKTSNSSYLRTIVGFLMRGETVILTIALTTASFLYKNRVLITHRRR